MAFKIKAADQKCIEDACKLVSVSRTAVEQAVEQFNVELDAARVKLQSVIDHHNEMVDQTRGIIEDVHRELDEEFDGKSERWQDSDKGNATREWIDSISEAAEQFVTIALDFPEAVEPDELLGDDPVEGFNELTSEPAESE